MLEKAREFRPVIYRLKYVQPKFQEMIRAEAGACVEPVMACWDGGVSTTVAPLGICRCVTCGKMYPWKSDKKAGVHGVDAGHFLKGKRASVVLEETGCHPQCQYCNGHMDGAPLEYDRFMRHRYGQEEIDRLKHLNRNVSRQFTLEELVTLRIGYMDRTKAAIAKMK